MNRDEQAAGKAGHRALSRRAFLGTTAAALAAPSLLRGLGQAGPGETLHIGCIGVGDQGTRDMRTFLERRGVRVIAVCDVDAANRDRARDIVRKHYGDESCAAHADFREMLEREKGIDAVLVVTPDHWHAAMSLHAMKLGKHVYCQKPLTHTVHEARVLGDAARKLAVATQAGTVNQASEASRLIREMIWDGAIGGVREVHNWSNRPIWPQGIDRPKDTPPAPPGLDWDLWLGPAPHRPYHPAYLPLVWRGWRDFGTGALGDMGCYSFDTIFRALRLGAPRSVEASCAGFAPRMWSEVQVSEETYPAASIIHWDFGAREGMPPVRLTWYDGGLRPPGPEELEGAEIQREGLLFAGDKGKLLCDFGGGNPRLLPEGRMREYRQPPQTIPRSIGHHEEWIEAAKGGKSAGANFEFSGRVSEALLLGNAALRARKKLLWDSAAFRFPNAPEMDQHLRMDYRAPWTLDLGSA